MKIVTLLVTLFVATFAVSAESVDKVLNPYFTADGAVYVNVLTNPEYIKEAQSLGKENFEIFKSLTKFDTVLFTGEVDALRTLADTLAGDANMEQIYNLENKDEQDGQSQNPLLKSLSINIFPLFDYISAYALKDGDFYTDFVYIIHIQPTNSAVVAYIKGNLTEEQLKYALPQVSQDIKLTPCID